MKILGIISARGGSKGVPGKNIKLLGDKPLIAHTIASALQSKLLSKIVVSSDDDAIIEVAKNLGIEVPFKRPAHLATNEASSIEVVQHTVAFLENEGEYYNAICLLQPTSPMRYKGFIDEAIEKFQENEYEALVSVLPVPHEYNPHWVFEANENGNLKIATGEKEIIKRRQDLPKAFIRDGAIYITKTTLIKNGSFYGTHLGFIENNPSFYVNIDTPNDWKIAEEKWNLLKDKI